MTDIDRIRDRLLGLADDPWYVEEAEHVAEAMRRVAPLIRTPREAIIAFAALGWDLDGARAMVCEVGHGSGANCARCPTMEESPQAPPSTSSPILDSLEAARAMCTVDDDRDERFAFFVAVHVGDETRYVAAYPRDGSAVGAREDVAIWLSHIINRGRWEGVHMAPLVQPVPPPDPQQPAPSTSLPTRTELADIERWLDAEALCRGPIGGANTALWVWRLGAYTNSKPVLVHRLRYAERYAARVANDFPGEDGARAGRYLAKLRDLLVRMGNDQPR